MKRIKALGLFSVIFVLSAVQMLQAKETYNLDMRDAHLTDFIKLVSEATGQYFLLDTAVIDKKVTIITGRELDAEELGNTLEHLLAMNGMLAVKTDTLTMIVPQHIPKVKAIDFVPEDKFVKRSRKYKSDQVITTIVTVQYKPVSELASSVRSSLSYTGYLQEYTASNRILITDTASKVIKAVKYLRALDNLDDSALEVVVVKDAIASELFKIIKTEIDAKYKAADTKPTISFDARTNSLVITGSEKERAYLKNLITKLDKPSSKDETSP